MKSIAQEHDCLLIDLDGTVCFVAVSPPAARCSR